MKLFSYGKDGGPESKVWGFWFIELKSLFSIVLLKFEPGTREAYHTHAFNCFSWVLRGKLEERFKDSRKKLYHSASVLPFITRRSDFHQVYSHGTSWVLSFRGPWNNTWEEYFPSSRVRVTLTNGRKLYVSDDQL